jgi:ribonuclease J
MNSALHEMRRKTEQAERTLRRFRKMKASPISASDDKLRIIPLGGQDGIGEKNMIVVEYGNDALILDCGFALGIDLPGVNYAIPATDYLETIRHKLRGYVISHGHLDHIGALTHVVPKFPAPILGSNFTIGMAKMQFEKLAERGEEFTPDYYVLNMDTHERMKLGKMEVELVRVTHAIPESSAIVVDTPAGRVINTGDFRLDPEPLDDKPTDIKRLKELGNEGVLMLLSESTNTTKPGRTPTEHTLQESFHNLIAETKGRLFVGVFSSNMNRIQMIVNAAHAAGRKIVFDGRSMLATAELAVRLGNLKIPKNTIVALREATNIPDGKLIVLCTGGQGEPGAALSRMAIGEHPIFKLKRGDTVVVSSTPIPGNELSYQRIGDDLMEIGAKLYRHPTHELDGSGPLHVSGHAYRDEHAEMIRLTRPKFFMPIYGGPTQRSYHRQIALAEGIVAKNIVMATNGDVVEVGKGARVSGKVTSGSLLIDKSGAIVPELVTRDRLLLQHEGFVTIVVLLNKQGRLVSSPDIITRGHIAIRENETLMNRLRAEIRKQANIKKTTRSEIDTLKKRLGLVVQTRLYEETGQVPIIGVVVNASKD